MSGDPRDPLDTLDRDPAARFHQGTIARLYAGSQRGVLHTGSGRDVPFAVPDVRILGTDAGFAALQEGMRVGFDLGWTSRGLRVTVIRVPDQSGSDVR